MIHNKPLRAYIEHPETMDEETVATLKELTERYPYFHAARILYLRALYQTHSYQFDGELKQSAMLVPSRKAIFHLIEEHNYAPREEKLQSKAAQKRDEAPIDITGSLIDSFLNSLPQEKKPAKRVKADASVDYMEYLLQTEQEELEEKETTPMHGDKLITNFLSHQDEGRIVLHDVPEQELQKPELISETSPDTEIFTEALARIYIKQGKYERAIEIIRRLSLKYPKKNRYFADQIRFLEKLIINNKYKKQ